MVDEPDARRAREVAVAPTVVATEIGARSPTDHPTDGSEPEPTELRRGDLVGRYIVVERLGVGGMGVVYSAFDPELDRKVAIKLLQQRSGGSTGPIRLLREAKAMARLAHPGVITVHDVGLVDNRVFIAMELVEGQTLREWLSTPRTWREVVAIFLQAGEGLAAAHAAGLVHRDFKPDNVLVGDDGRVRVLDFGLAQAISGEVTEPQTRPPTGRAEPKAELAALSGSSLLRSAGLTDLSLSAAALSRDGAIAGTPAYMAPEQHLGADVDARSDLFAFSVALWEGLYGCHPFAAETRLGLIAAVTRGELRAPPAERRIPRWLHNLLLRGLKADPHDRPPTMRSLLDALRRGRRRRRSALTLAIGGLLIAASAGTTWAVVDRAPAATAPCQGSRARLDGIWDREVAAAGAAAFTGSGVVYAEATWAALAGELDDYSDAWATMHRETCEATHLRGEQSTALLDLRMTCLNSHLEELTAATELLRAADPGLIPQARRVVGGLPPLERCADPQRLGERLPLPEALGARRRIDGLQARLARIRVRLHAGQIREALAQLPPILEEARSADYPPLLAAATLVHGQLLDRNGEPEAAAEVLIDAVTLGLTFRDDPLAATAMIELIYTVGIRLARAEDALLWARLAAATTERLPTGGERDDLTARRLEREGIVLAQRGEVERGRQRQEEALALAEATHGPSSLETAALRLNLSATLADLGALDLAQGHLEAAIQTLIHELGADHPHVAVARNNLGTLFTSLGMPEEALLEHRRALAIKERTLGADHLSTANSHNNIASALLYRETPEDLETAIVHADRALAIKRASLGADSPLLAETLGIRAELAFLRGETDDAAALVAEALELAAGFASDDGAATLPQKLPLHRIAGTIAAARGDLTGAEAHFQAALAIHREVPGAPEFYVDLLQRYADFLWEHAGAPAAARRLLEEAVAAEHLPPPHRQTLERWLATHGGSGPPAAGG